MRALKLQREERWAINPLRRLTSRRNRLPQVGFKNLVVGIAPVEAPDGTPRIILVVTFVIRTLGTAPAWTGTLEHEARTVRRFLRVPSMFDASTEGRNTTFLFLDPKWRDLSQQRILESSDEGSRIQEICPLTHEDFSLRGQHTWRFHLCEFPYSWSTFYRFFNVSSVASQRVTVRQCMIVSITPWVRPCTSAHWSYWSSRWRRFDWFDAIRITWTRLLPLQLWASVSWLSYKSRTEQKKRWAGDLVSTSARFEIKLYPVHHTLTHRCVCCKVDAHARHVEGTSFALGRAGHGNRRCSLLTCRGREKKNSTKLRPTTCTSVKLNAHAGVTNEQEAGERRTNYWQKYIRLRHSVLWRTPARTGATVKCFSSVRSCVVVYLASRGHRCGTPSARGLFLGFSGALSSFSAVSGLLLSQGLDQLPRNLPMDLWTVRWRLCHCRLGDRHAHPADHTSEFWCPWTC